jgi:hypothetical protein
MLKDKLVVIGILDAEGKEKGVLHHMIYEDEKLKHKLLVQGVTTNKNYDSLSEGYKLSTLHYNKKMKWLYK